MQGPRAAARRPSPCTGWPTCSTAGRDTLSAKDIVVVSPNQVFNDYISGVLPDLGEENMQQTTFSQMVRSTWARRLGEGSRSKTAAPTWSTSLPSEDTPGYDLRVKEVQYKGSPAFFAEVQKYIERLHQGEEIDFPDIVYEGQRGDLGRARSASW